MTSKLKEFKGSLNVIFDDGQVRLASDVEIDESIVRLIALDKIKARSNQPRKTFHEGSLKELADSIRAHGIIQPITVQQSDNNKFEIIVGERRWRAAQKAGLTTIPCLVRSFNDKNMMSVALIENLQREDLNSLEAAQAMAELIDVYQMTHEQLATHLGKSRASISNWLRLLHLDERVQSLLREGYLTMGHARALLALSTEQQWHIAKLIKERSLSVRDTEQWVAQLQKPKQVAQQQSAIDPAFRLKAKTWQEQFAQKLTVKVSINEKGQGKVAFNFSSIDEANWLLEHLDIKD